MIVQTKNTNQKMNKKIGQLVYRFKISRRRRSLLRRRELAIAGSRLKRIETRFGHFALSPKPLLVVGALMIVMQPILVTNINSVGAASNPALALTGYIWENEDGSAPDTVSQIAAADGSIEAPWGSRINLRAQLKNTGDALADTNLGLFYDKGDGLWNQAVNSSPKTNPNALPVSTVIDNTSSMGQRNSIAVDNNNKVWISYHDNGFKNLVVAEYVGSGGSDCTSAEWTCTTIDSTGSVGFQTAIAIDSNNNPVISYYDSTNYNLKLASYVGSGGTGCAAGITNWSCQTIDTTGDVGNYSSVAFKSDDEIWISYNDSTNDDLKIANYVGGTGGSCNNTAWDCYSIDGLGTATVVDNMLAFDNEGAAWISYSDDGDLDGNSSATIANYVGSGGAGCSDTSAWACTELFTGYAGGASGLAFDDDGNPWMSFTDGAGAGGDNLAVARYVGTSGTGCAGGLTTWTCELVEDTPWLSTTTESTARSNVYDVTLTADNFDVHDELFFDNAGTDYTATIVIDNNDGTYRLSKKVSHDSSVTVTNVKYTLGVYTSIAFDNEGTPWIAHKESTNDKARVAKYVGTGGTGCYGGSTAWSCTQVSSLGAHDAGDFIKITFDNYNTAWFSYMDATDGSLIVTKLTDWPTGGGCANDAFAAAWECSDVVTSGGAGRQSSMALDNSGVPWIAYVDSSNSDLEIAKYVGKGGSGCAVASWECSVVESTSAVGYHPSLTFDEGNNPWVSHRNETTNDLRVSHYVGSGGSCDNTAWECEGVDTTGDIDSFTSIAVDSSNAAWVSYKDATAGTLKVANYVGGGSGSGCNDNDWACTTVEGANSNGEGSSIAFDTAGDAWVSFFSTGGSPGDELQIARYVGSGGTGCNSSAWTCSVIYDDNLVNNTSIAFDPAGDAWIAFKVNTGDLIVAKYVGSGGSNCGSGVTDWDCTVVEDTNDNGQGASITFDPAGNAWISYQDETDLTIKVARYVGAGGSGCASSAWTCNVVQSGVPNSNMGSTLVFDNNGTAWLSYYDDTGVDLKLAKLERAGEILLSQAQRYANGAVISESHADMTSVTDTTNRDDADCIGGGTWNNGKYFNSNLGSGISLPDGSSTAQCTEVVFTLDLAQAEVGDNYRFMIATKDSWDPNKSTWRGLSGGGTPPELRVTDISFISGKDNSRRLPNCDTDTDWGCEVLDIGTNDDLPYPKLAFDTNGNAWAAWEDESNDDLEVANYVGSGGNCDDSGGSDAWHCETVAPVGAFGGFVGIATGEDGSVWVSYYYSTDGTLRAAKYVGGASGTCEDFDGPSTGSSAWDCWKVNDETSQNVGSRSDIAIDPQGNPWISYYDQTLFDLKVARWVGGSDGNCAGATGSSWDCETVDSTGNSGRYSSIAIGNDGDVWVEHHDHSLEGGGDDIRIARYVGSGGDCTSDAWDCEILDDSAGEYGAIAIDHNGNPWVSYRDNVTGQHDLTVARYVGSGGDCTSDAWDCVEVDSSSSSIGYQSSVAIAPDGNPWVAYQDGANSALKYAKYVGSGGNCDVAGGSDAWNCSTIESTDNVGNYPYIAFDFNGAAWIISSDTTNDSTRIAKLHMPSVSLTTDYNNRVLARNAGNGFARYLSSFGKANANNPGICNGISDYYGACGLFSASGDYDTITAQANESPYWTFAQRFDRNNELPTAQWEGTSSLAPNTSGTTGDIVLQVYRYGTTNAWETVVSDTASSSCSTTNCRLEGIPTGTASEYFESKDGKYWVNYRLYQEPSTSSSVTFKTDQFKAATNEQRARHGSYLQDGYKRPLNWR